MLPSEELLNKYRAAEKGGTSDPAPVSAAADEKKEVSAPEAKAETVQPATAGESNGQGSTNQNTPVPAASSEGERDERTRYQRDWEKRLKRQERSHQEQMAALRREFEEYKKAHEGSRPELRPEDFPTREKYEEYKENQMEERIRGRIMDEQRQERESEAKLSEQRERAQKKLEATFRTPEAIAEFKQRLGNWVKDEAEFLDSDNGQLFQEFLDSSKLGLVMTDLLIKNPEAMGDFKNCSKYMMLHQLERLEQGIIAKAKEQQQKAETPAAPAEAAKNPTPATKPVMPSTGDIGKTQTATGKFSARDWLRKNRPERYH